MRVVSTRVVRLLRGSLLLLAGAAGSCGPERPPPPNVLLISIDSLRADHLGCYGYARNTSPAIDAFARSSILFHKAVSQAPWTLPAHASLLTSQYTRTHQLTDVRRRLPPEIPTIARALRERGYQTAAVVSGPWMKAVFGFDAGFDHYDDSLAAGRKKSHSAVTCPDLHAKAIELLDRFSADRPFFLFLHYWDVHYDYMPPAPFDTLFDPDYSGTMTAHNFETSPKIHAAMDPRDLEHIIALYDGEIRYLDSHFERLLAELRRRELNERTIVIFTADHGDEFYDHGEKGHEHSTYNELIHVPLIVRLPGNAGGRQVSRTVQLVDLFPTILDVVGGDPNAFPLQGESLYGLCVGDEGEESPAFADTTRFCRVKAAGSRRSYAECVVWGRYKLIRYAKPGLPDELYDLVRDPREQEPIQEEKVGRELARLLDSWRSRLPRGQLTPNRGVDAETMRRLKSLGYIGD